MDELRQRGNDWQELVVKTAIEEQGECGPDPWLLQLQMLGSKWVHMDEAMCEAMGGDGDAAVPEMLRDGPSKADPAKAVAETPEWNAYSTPERRRIARRLVWPMPRPQPDDRVPDAPRLPWSPGTAPVWAAVATSTPKQAWTGE